MSLRKRIDEIEKRFYSLESEIKSLREQNGNLKAQLADARAPREKVVSVRDNSGGPWKQERHDAEKN